MATTPLPHYHSAIIYYGHKREHSAQIAVFSDVPAQKAAASAAT